MQYGLRWHLQSTLLSWNIYVSRQWCWVDWSSTKVIWNHKCSAPVAVSTGKTWKQRKKRIGSKGKKGVRQGLAVFQIPSGAGDTRQSSSFWENSNPNGVCLLFLCSWDHIGWQLATGMSKTGAGTFTEMSVVCSGLPVSCATGGLFTLPPLLLAVRAANVILSL